jgi:DNA-directed RNA polymerase specialized sigma24 family protein
MNLEDISKRDKEWRAMALSICSDKMLADDLVQEMYLKLYPNDYEKINSNFIYRVLMSIFLDYLRNKKTVSISEFYYLKSNDNIFEPDDDQQELLNRFSNLSWRQQELIAESYDRSLREIEKTFPLINYGYAYRQIHLGLKEILGDNYEKYINKHYKHRK